MHTLRIIYLSFIFFVFVSLNVYNCVYPLFIYLYIFNRNNCIVFFFFLGCECFYTTKKYTGLGRVYDFEFDLKLNIRKHSPTN